MARKPKSSETFAEARNRYEATKKAVKTMRGLVDKDVLAAMRKAEAEARKAMEAARARENRAREKRAGSAEAALKTWIGGELLALTGLRWTQVDPRKWSILMADCGAELREDIECPEMGVDEAYELCQAWQVAIRNGTANRETGEIEAAAEAEPEPAEHPVDIEWRDEPETAAPQPEAPEYAATNVWSCPVCGNNADELRPWRAMRPLDNPPLCSSQTCKGRDVAMVPHPPVR